MISFFRVWLIKGIQLLLSDTTPIGGGNYLRPGGVDTYLRPGGVDTYERPA